MATIPFTFRTAPVAPILAAFLAGAAPAGADDTLGGDLGWLRPALAAAGLSFSLDYTGETLGVVSGGVKRGFVYEGEAAFSLDADLDKALGWPGATAHVGAINVHGRGPSADLLGGNLMTASNIEARTVTQLYTLWLEQSLADDRIAVRLGQLAADDEFMASDTAGNLINGTFGWAAAASANMTQGGPAYPLADPGIRLRFSSTKEITVLTGVFAGNPGGEGCAGDPQLCNGHGTTFSLSGGTLWIGEVQYAAGGGIYKLGAWRETGAFPNQLTGANDKRGDWELYGIADRRLWTRPGTEDQGLSVFVRVAGSPEDRNQVAWYVDGGFGFKGPFAGRPDDTLTLGVAYAAISDDAAAADRAAGPPTPVRDFESVVELSYTAHLVPWWTLKPDLQYVIHPGGRAADPVKPGRAIPNALVLGLRSSIAF